jgi:hypothetical protein
VELSHGLAIVGDVLEYVAAEDDVELLVLEGNRGDVYRYDIPRARMDVRPNVT